MTCSLGTKTLEIVWNRMLKTDIVGSIAWRIIMWNVCLLIELYARFCNLHKRHHDLANPISFTQDSLVSIIYYVFLF